MNHFRVPLSVFLLSPLFHMVLKAGQGVQAPATVLLSLHIQQASDKLELYLAGWMLLQGLLVRHALGFSSDALGFIY